MSERFEKLFSLEKNLYTRGAPLLICAGSMLYDSYSKNYLAQIKYKNISDNTIKALKISITMLDTAGNEIEKKLEYRYLDLNASRDVEFGQKSAVVLPTDAVRSFSLAVTEVLYADDSKWLWDGTPWLPLSPLKTLAQAYGDAELEVQYKIRYGSVCSYEPLEEQDLWFCTCGAVNHDTERSCHSCRKVLSALKEVNLASLKQECAERLKSEGEQQVIIEEETKQKKKKRLKLAAILVPLLFVAVLLAAFIPGVVKRSSAYADAADMLAAGKYENAEKAFEALGDYKDSARMAAKEVPYARALRVMELAEKGDDKGLRLLSIPRSSLDEDDNVSVILYEAASKEFKALGDYKDSANLSADCLAAVEKLKDSDIEARYAAALALLNEQKFCEARDAFTELGDYKDSAEMAKEAIYEKALSLYNFMENNSFRYVYASLSTDTSVPSRAYIAQEDALKQGEDYITALNAAFGRDSVDIDIKEMDEDLLPLHKAVAELFISLVNYKDSPAYVDKVEELGDYTREFYNYIDSGDLHAAMAWLDGYEEEFEDRELWIERINQYMPLCGKWELNSGDSTLIASSVGANATCSTVNASVIIKEDAVILRLSVEGADSVAAELSAEPGSGSFYMSDGQGYNYCAALNVFDRIAYTKYGGSTNPLSSCDYVRAG